MKRVLFTLWLPLILVACSTKNNTPAPDAGADLAGEYTLSRTAKFTNNDTDYDFTLPKTIGTSSQTGTLSITRSSATAVYVAVVSQVQQMGKVSSSTTTFGKMDIKPTASGYELSQYNISNQKTGTGSTNGTTMTIELSDTYAPTMTTTRYLLEAKR